MFDRKTKLGYSMERQLITGKQNGDIFDRKTVKWEDNVNGKTKFWYSMGRQNFDI